MGGVEVRVVMTSPVKDAPRAPPCVGTSGELVSYVVNSGPGQEKSLTSLKLVTCGATMLDIPVSQKLPIVMAYGM
jgi:hypothetical protein